MMTIQISTKLSMFAQCAIASFWMYMTVSCKENQTKKLQTKLVKLARVFFKTWNRAKE